MSNDIKIYLKIFDDIERYWKILEDIEIDILEDLLSFGNLLNEWMLRFGKRFLKDNIFFDFLSSLAK